MPHTLKRSPIAGEELGDALATLRERAPLVQCLTNIVAANFTANVLLALGASPAMVDNPREAEAFAGRADGVLVNLGTPRAGTVEAMALAVRGAEAAGTPWVLDPVGVGVLPWRTSVATGLLTQHHPAIVRGNASEILALSGGSGGKGVDSLATADQALGAAVAIATGRGAVVAVSGAIDHLTDGASLVRIQNGHPYLTRVTGSGCALGAVMAAFAAVVDEPLRAAAAATAVFTIAADEAGEQAAGPGSFAVALLDSLHRLTPEIVAAAVRLG